MLWERRRGIINQFYRVLTHAYNTNSMYYKHEALPMGSCKTNRTWHCLPRSHMEQFGVRPTKRILGVNTMSDSPSGMLTEWPFYLHFLQTMALNSVSSVITTQAY